MDIAVSQAASLGTAALQYLNELLDSRETAKCWYGENHYHDFTKWNLFSRNILVANPSRKITKVFTIRAGGWDKAIGECVYNHQLWRRFAVRTDGDCSWLPIYEAVSEKDKKSYLSGAKKSAGFVATAKSLPAARLDAWGLVVLSLANGAKPQVTHNSNGGFYAELSGKDFVITMWQQDISGEIVGHIEPRAQASERHTAMTSPEWQNLLWYGHSFSKHHHMFGWPLNGVPLQEPPKNLTTSHHDGELKVLVMDNQWAEILQDRLRDALYECYDTWDAVQKDLEQQKKLSDENKNKIEQTKDHIKSFKLILVDKVNAIETSLVFELREHDILHYATNQLNFAKSLNQNQLKENQQMEEGSHSGGSRTEANHNEESLSDANLSEASISEAEHQRENHQEKQETENRQSSIIQKLLQRQKVVVALTRLLVLPQRIDYILSTRTTGTCVLVV
ncbi:hypothetical protein V2G26_019520 [Clonostachys chloroleuca]